MDVCHAQLPGASIESAGEANKACLHSMLATLNRSNLQLNIPTGGNTMKKYILAFALSALAATHEFADEKPSE